MRSRGAEQGQHSGNTATGRHRHRGNSDPMGSSKGSAGTALRFYLRRNRINVNEDSGFEVGPVFEFIDYPNVPSLIAAAISSGKATLHELNTVYGIEDVYDLLEVATVDVHNRRVASKKAPA